MNENKDKVSGKWKTCYWVSIISKQTNVVNNIFKMTKDDLPKICNYDMLIKLCCWCLLMSSIGIIFGGALSSMPPIALVLTNFLCVQQLAIPPSSLHYLGLSTILICAKSIYYSSWWYWDILVFHLFILWHSCFFCVLWICLACKNNDRHFIWLSLHIRYPNLETYPTLDNYLKGKNGYSHLLHLCGLGWVTWPTIPCEGQKTWD